jgi:hypothetical protein
MDPLQKQVDAKLQELFDTFDIDLDHKIGKKEWVWIDMGVCFDTGGQYDAHSRAERFNNMDVDHAGQISFGAFKERLTRIWDREGWSQEQRLSELEKEIQIVQEERIRLGPRYNPAVRAKLLKLFDAYSCGTKRPVQYILPSDWIEGQRTLAVLNELDPSWVNELRFYIGNVDGTGKLTVDQYLEAMFKAFDEYEKGADGAPDEAKRALIPPMLDAMLKKLNGRDRPTIVNIHVHVRQEKPSPRPPDPTLKPYPIGVINPDLANGIPGSYMPPVDKKNKGANELLKNAACEWTELKVVPEDPNLPTEWLAVGLNSSIRELEAIIRMYLHVDPKWAMAFLTVKDGKVESVGSDSGMREFLKAAQDAPRKEPIKLWVKNLRSIFTSVAVPIDLLSLTEEEQNELYGTQPGVRHGLDYDFFTIKQVTYPPEELTLKVGDALVIKSPVTLATNTYTLVHRIYVAGKDETGKDLMGQPIEEKVEPKVKKGKPPKDAAIFFTLVAQAVGSAQVLVEINWEAEEPNLCEKLGHQEVFQCDSVCRIGPFTVKIEDMEGKKAPPANAAGLAPIEFWNGEQYGGKPKKAKPPKMAKPK